MRVWVDGRSVGEWVGGWKVVVVHRWVASVWVDDGRGAGPLTHRGPVDLSLLPLQPTVDTTGAVFRTCRIRTQNQVWAACLFWDEGYAGLHLSPSLEISVPATCILQPRLGGRCMNGWVSNDWLVGR